MADNQHGVELTSSHLRRHSAKMPKLVTMLTRDRGIEYLDIVELE